jgi:hypothetical protein
MESWSRGIVAPLFHYWDRHENKLIADSGRCATSAMTIGGTPETLAPS